MARGRPSISGRRYKGGKRVPVLVYDHGADHIIQSRSRFASFHKGKASQQIFDPLGRAWAVGLFENDRIDPAVLRDAGRAYAERYWGYYPSSPGVCNYDASVRKGNGSEHDSAGRKFQALDNTLQSAGSPIYSATAQLCLDFHYTPDRNPGWLDRLINDRLVKANVEVSGQLSRPEDQALLTLALHGLMALAGEEKIAA